MKLSKHIFNEVKRRVTNYLCASHVLNPAGITVCLGRRFTGPAMGAYFARDAHEAMDILSSREVRNLFLDAEQWWEASLLLRLLNEDRLNHWPRFRPVVISLYGKKGDREFLEDYVDRAGVYNNNGRKKAHA